MQYLWLTLVTSDIDECVTGMDNCDENAVCIDTFGGFTCVCNAGFTGDGVNCVVGEWVVVFLVGDHNYSLSIIEC